MKEREKIGEVMRRAGEPFISCGRAGDTRVVLPESPQVIEKEGIDLRNNAEKRHKSAEVLEREGVGFGKREEGQFELVFLHY